MAYYSAIKKNLPFVTTQMNLKSIMKGDMSEKDKYCMFSLICGILKTRQINAYNKTETYSDTENKLCLPVVRAVRGEP